MQWQTDFRRRSEEEEVKEHGLTLDFDEIAKKGSMTKEEKLIAKWYGIYASRQEGNHMARVTIPGGVLSTTQARNIADVAEHYAQGKLCITTRQAIQFHWLKVKGLPDMTRDLRSEGNSTFHGCGDVTRTMTACPLAETCEYRRFNVRPWAQKTMKYLTDARDLDNLPRKFKITFSGCGAGCAQPYINCVGNIAVRRKKADGTFENGFKMVIGGGMGWEAYVAQELFSFIPEKLIPQVSRAVALLFRDHGDRFNRQTSRLKFVVARLGIETCRQIVLDFLKGEGVPTENLSTDSFKDEGKNYSKRPLTIESPVGTDGKATVRAMVPMGELDHHQLRAMAELADVYGNQNLYTTNRQNLELMGVEPAKVEEVRTKIAALGFGTEGFYGLRDIVPCVGTTYCPKAVATTHDLYKLLMPIVSQSKYKTVEKRAIINITGCPNSCSPFRISDIGFRGMRIREELGSVEGFELLLGGDQQKYGQKLGDFKTADLPAVVETILDTFVKIRTQEESLTETVVRVGLEPFAKAVFA